jgi:pectate lyase
MASTSIWVPKMRHFSKPIVASIVIAVLTVPVLVYVFFPTLSGWFYMTAIQPKSANNAVTVYGLPAFPGAEGFGSTTPGGRGGRVIEVTNLDEAGPGSFRAALESSGPRIVIFRVGGTIKATKAFAIDSPFITIAGQTAPGSGITLRGAPVVIRTHDVVVRGLRVRIGDRLGGNLVAPDGIRIEGSNSSPAYNIIIDHCSISWAIDENLSTYSNVSDVTIQWNISSEALKRSVHPKGVHSMGLLINYNAQRISIHHNLFAHNDKRNPKLAGNTATEVINNVIYNWGDLATHMANDKYKLAWSFANIIGNIYKPGADTKLAEGIEIESNVNTGAKVYIHGNINEGMASGSPDDWATVAGSAEYRSPVPVLPPSGITTQSAYVAYDLVLEYAGATSPMRDEIDERVVQSVRDSTGRQIDSQQEVGGWVEMKGGKPPLDTDHDGMPDKWEVAHGLDPHNGADGSTLAPSGYTHVEVYINELIRIPSNIQ